jgi:hypothetical protein
MGWPIAKGGNRRDQNHSRQISVASAPVGRTVCDAVHNSGGQIDGGGSNRLQGTGQQPTMPARNARGPLSRPRDTRKAFVNHF